MLWEALGCCELEKKRNLGWWGVQTMWGRRQKPQNIFFSIVTSLRSSSNYLQWDGMAWTSRLTPLKSGGEKMAKQIKKDQDMQYRQELTPYILWQIWKARNAWLFTGERRTEREIVQLDWQECIEFKEKQERRVRGSEGRIRVEAQQGWTAPEYGTIKINTCSICDPNCNKVGLGILARNNNSRCVQA